MNCGRSQYTYTFAQNIKTAICFPVVSLDKRSNDHLSRIQRAIDYIENHLKDYLRRKATPRVLFTWHFQSFLALWWEIH